MLSAPLTGAAQTLVQPTMATTVDYRDDDSWLCRPGRQDPCAADQRTTVVQADGRMEIEAFRPDRNPPIDCFYVYPTVSADGGGNSDLDAGAEERRVVEQQLARFASKCRLFAPLYRQVTLTALRAATSGQPIPADRERAYGDVKAAWADYLARDNGGRGVVLIGHSQGSGVLRRLIAEEIDGKPIQSRLVSALLTGTNIAVPAGQDVGGDFKSVRLCRSRVQTGCLVAYVSFRATQPPPEGSRFGKVQTPGMQAACVHPGALAGGRAPLRAHLSNRAMIADSAAAPPAWVTPARSIGSPFIAVPGLLSAQCVNDARGSYLSVQVNGVPSDPRADDIAGDVIVGGRVLADWGLHLIDMNLAMGDLVDLVGVQSEAFTARRAASPHRLGPQSAPRSGDDAGHP